MVLLRTLRVVKLLTAEDYEQRNTRAARLPAGSY